jgi:hypothetical protein
MSGCAYFAYLRVEVKRNTDRGHAKFACSSRRSLATRLRGTIVFGRKYRAPGGAEEDLMPREKSQQPPSDTATDWDEWMDKHAGPPRPVSDVADAEGRFTVETTEPIPEPGSTLAVQQQKAGARKIVHKAAHAATRKQTIARLPKRKLTR